MRPFALTQNFRTPNGDFAPRVGLAWSIDSKTVLRVNGGMFYEAPPTNLWYNALINDGSPKSFVSTLSAGVRRRAFLPERTHVYRGRGSRNPGHHHGHSEFQERLHAECEPPD